MPPGVDSTNCKDGSGLQGPGESPASALWKGFLQVSFILFLLRPVSFHTLAFQS